jgi:acyl-CoA synthetase (AMP-forming)/AMP-acid ligase II
MSLIMSALDSPQAARSRLFCLSDGPEPVTFAELGTQARRAAAWLETLAGRGATVAALLTASVDCLAVVMGAFRSGVTLVSLPHPARGMGVEEYLSQISTMCALTGATHLLAEPDHLGLLGDAPVPVHGFNELASTHATLDGDSPGSFVQFTSGSTGSPRGIKLSLEAIEANLISMLDWLEPPPEPVICSWLPLSHDMGLIGYALYTLCSASPPWSAAPDLVLLTPETFLSDPGSWLVACTDYRATSTAAPPFALRLAARALRAARRPYDLSTLKTFVVGSEPISAQGLREFEAEGARYGLSPHALSPGYGLAEVALTVSTASHQEPWRSVHLDPDALAARTWSEVAEGGVELVSCGPPILNVEVRTTTGPGVDELEVKSPSLLSGYVGDATAPVSPDGWLHTADLAHIEGGELFIIGRTDDVFIIAGRNIDARDLDQVAATHPAIRPGNVACVQDGNGRYVVVAEPNTPMPDAAALRQADREIRVSLMQRFSASPSAVIFIERGTLPKTPSGKIRRNHLEILWRDGRLSEVTLS